MILYVDSLEDYRLLSSRPEAVDSRSLGRSLRNRELAGMGSANVVAVCLGNMRQFAESERPDDGEAQLALVESQAKETVVHELQPYL